MGSLFSRQPGERSIYSTDLALLDCVKQNNWETLRNDKSVFLTFDLSSDTTTNPFRNVYNILFDQVVAPRQEILLLFPNHEAYDKRKLVLPAYSSRPEVVGREINERLSKSSPEIMWVMIGGKIIELKGFRGVVYFLSGERVTQLNRNREESSIGKDIPILIQTDGYEIVTHILLFQPDARPLNLPLDAVSPMTPYRNINLFPCEIQRCETERPIKTFTRNDALAKTTQNVLDSLRVPPLKKKMVESDGEISREGDVLELIKE